MWKSTEKIKSIHTRSSKGHVESRFLSFAYSPIMSRLFQINHFKYKLDAGWQLAGYLARYNGNERK